MYKFLCGHMFSFLLSICLGVCQSVCIAITKYYRLGIYKKQKFISFHTGGWKSEVSTLAWSGEDPLQGLRLPFVSSHDGRGWGALWALFYKNINLIHEGSTLMT